MHDLSTSSFLLLASRAAVLGSTDSQDKSVLGCVCVSFQDVHDDRVLVFGQAYTATNSGISDCGRPTLCRSQPISCPGICLGDYLDSYTFGPISLPYTTHVAFKDVIVLAPFLLDKRT